MIDTSKDVRSIIFFAHNRQDAAVKRRAKSFLDVGVELTGFMFRRDDDRSPSFDDWKNVDLGYIEHQRYLLRIWSLIIALVTVVKHRQIIKDADVLYFRNLDLGILCYLGKIFSGSQAKVVYECLDVHELLIGNSLVSKCARWLERQLLKRINLLVVSSNGFLYEYFLPTQRYSGKSYVLENKLYFSDSKIHRPRSLASNPDKEKLTLVWVGILRCQKTLSILKETAKEMGDALEIRLHGRISEFLIPDFEDQIKPFSNIQYFGPYQWPDGLQEAYADADLVWGQELDWENGNSDWLVPNRVYEAPFFGVPVVSVLGTETARLVKTRDLGYVIQAANSEELIQLLECLDDKALSDQKSRLLKSDSRHFVANREDTNLLLEHAVSG